VSNFIVDVEADGPVPGLYSMISIGAVLLDEKLDKTFYGQLRPISDVWIPDALAVSGHTREETMTFRDPKYVMQEFASWIEKHNTGRAVFWADNNGFDFAMVNYYFHAFYGSNPFGWSSQNINSLYKGIVNDMYASFKHLRKTKHTHHPVDDARGNAEALLAMKANGLKIKLG
jgi:hypothetical protein